MAVAELYSKPENYEGMPLPGTVEHLEWLTRFDIAEDLSFDELQNFLLETQAVNSFVNFTRQHRMISHIPRRHRAEFDTRLLGLDPHEWRSTFRSAIEISPELPDHGLLLIHGRPNPNESADLDYTYDVVLPVRDQNYHDPSYDPSRPMEAMYAWDKHQKIIDRKRRGFTEISQANQGEPVVVAMALQEAAVTACNLYRYLYGENEALPQMQPSPPELARFHPDFASDDPNEFMDRAQQSEDTYWNSGTDVLDA